MFQTEPHRWLQSFDSPFLRTAMEGVSLLGTEAFYTLLILVVMFGIDRHKGFIVVQVVLWTAIITAILKGLFALPRPVDVDSLVRDLSGERTHLSPFTSRDASSFFGLIPDDVVSYTRTLPNVSYGFPSGHCSSTVATWGSLCLLFRRPWLVWVTLALALLMPLSRMYLGRHFLADVVGGSAIGLLMVLIVAAFLRSRAYQEALLGEHAQEYGSTPRKKLFLSMTWAELVFLFVLPLGALFSSQSPNYNAATLLGLNAGYLLTDRLRALDQPRAILNRVLSVLVAVAVSVLLGLALGLLNSEFRLPNTPEVKLPQVSIVAALIVITSHGLVKALLLHRHSGRQA